MMEDEIDLRPYIRALVRYWYWIVGLAVVATLAALVLSWLLSPTYQASAVVLITESPYNIQFDARFDTEELKPAYRAFPTLATSDGVLGAVVDSYTPSPEAKVEKWNVPGLRSMVEANSQGDPSLLVLTVRSHSPEDAANIANLWADILVAQGNQLYGSTEEDVTFLQAQVAQAKDALERIEAALVEFEARNEIDTISARLTSLRETESQELTNQRQISFLVQDIRDLRDQIADQTENRESTLADSLTALLLQIKAFNAESTSPLQIQIQDNSSLVAQSPAEQTAMLDDLAIRLEARSAQIETRLKALEPEMLEAQQQIQELETERDRLDRQVSLSQETYVILVRKLDEARIAAQQDRNMMQVGSYAATPSSPSGPRKLLNALIGGTLGFLVGCVIALGIEFFRGERPVANREGLARGG